VERRRLLRWVILLTCTALAFPAFGQDAPGQEDAGQEDAGQEDDTSPPEEEEPDLRTRTRARDIQTATYYELVSWAERLSLATEGTRAELAERVAEHYDVELPDAPAEDLEGREVTIESAQDLQYFTLEDIEEDYVRLVGGVSVVLEDAQRDGVHRIQADELLLNRTEELLSASGNVEYVIERADDTERFRGESLSVELDDWSGSFLRGVSRRTREVDGEDIDFRFSGRHISRSPDDVVVLEDGRITSSEMDPPSYYIRADRIWVMDDGDWGLERGSLHVGRVPMLYFPYFFHPGRRMIFHPAIGSRDRMGTYLQTTYYIAGRREDEDEPLSFLQMTEVDEETPLEREGLFLRSAPEREKEPDEDTIRILGDVYTALGLHLGADLDLAPRDPLGATRWRLGLAATRLRYADPLTTDRATTFFVGDDGEVGEHWSPSMLPGARVPFRFYSDLSTELRELPGGTTITVGLPVYSDRYIERDLFDRAEHIDWGGLTGLSDSPEEPPGVRNRKAWDARARVSPRVDQLEPWVGRVSISPPIAASLAWRYRNVEDPPGYVAEAIDPPDGSFFYPDQFTLPSVRGRITGTLLEPPKPEPFEPREVPDDPELRPPRSPESGATAAERQETAAARDRNQLKRDGAGEEPEVRLPERPGDVSVVDPTYPWAYGIDYALRPRLDLEGWFDDDQWREPGDVDFGVRNWRSLRDLSGEISYHAGFDGPFLTADGSSLGFAHRRRRAFAFAEGVSPEEEEELRRRAAQADSVELDNTLALSTKPLGGVERLAESQVSYRLSKNLYEQSFEELDDELEPTYQEDWFRWDDEMVTEHRIDPALRVSLLGATQSLSTRADLPPLDERVTAALRLVTGPLTSELSTGFRGSPPEREYDPLRLRQDLEVTPNVSLGGSVDYEWEEEEVVAVAGDADAWFLSGQVEAERLEEEANELYVTRVSGQARTGGFLAALNMGRREGVTFEGAEEGWVRDGEPRLQPESADVSYSLEVEPDPMWRGRIRHELALESSLDVDFLRFTESSWDLEVDYALSIHRFLDLRLTTTSRNNAIYRYVPRLAEEIGVEPVNPLSDLIRSFAFFSPEDRRASAFNLHQFSIDLIQDLGEWDLEIGYRGEPRERTVNDVREYEWGSSLDIRVAWRPIPELDRDVRRADGDWEL